MGWLVETACLGAGFGTKSFGWWASRPKARFNVSCQSGPRFWSVSSVWHVDQLIGNRDTRGFNGHRIPQTQRCNDIWWTLDIHILLKSFSYFFPYDRPLLLRERQLVLLPEERTIEREAWIEILLVNKEQSATIDIHAARCTPDFFTSIHLGIRRSSTGNESCEVARCRLTRGGELRWDLERSRAQLGSSWYVVAVKYIFIFSWITYTHPPSLAQESTQSICRLRALCAGNAKHFKKSLLVITSYLVIGSIGDQENVVPSAGCGSFLCWGRAMYLCFWSQQTYNGT